MKQLTSLWRTKTATAVSESKSPRALEWVEVAPDRILVATPERVWIYRPSLATQDREVLTAQTDEGPTSPEIARKLLDSAIVLAKRAVTVKKTRQPLTPIRWVWWLAGAYRLTHSTPQLMAEAAQTFAASGRLELASWAAEKAREESGHDRLALLDLQSLGYDGLAVVETLVPPSSMTLLDYFTRCARNQDPIGCVGYAYTLERLALAIDEECVQEVEKVLPVNATRCLRVHSAIGSDVEHVAENVELVAKLSRQERIRVVLAVYETALLYFQGSGENAPSDAELQKCLRGSSLSPA